MARLTIAEKGKVGLAVLRDLPAETLSALIGEIERAGDSVSAVPDLSPEDTRRLMAALNWLSRVRAYTDVPVDEFVPDICEALREAGELEASTEPTLRERLEKVLDLDALNLSAKADVLRSEHQYIFCTARILTDARPVYGKKASEPPLAMIITHSLRISYHEGPGGPLKDIFMGLDSGDIAELHSVLQRAEEKARSLRGALEASKLRYIDPKK